MKYRHMIILAVFCPLTLQAGAFEPATYEECLLDTASRSTSDAAPQTIIDFCTNLFPVKMGLSEVNQKPESKIVPPTVLEKLSGSAGVKRDKLRRMPPQFTGLIFNNSSWVITDVTITIFPIEEIVSADKIKPVDENTKKALTQSCTSGMTRYARQGEGSTFEARPLTEAKFKCPEVYAPDGMNYSWYITSARGFKT